MSARIGSAWLLVFALLFLPTRSGSLPACCPAPPPGKAVVNADQTVIILWDPESKTEHFIRQASFKSDADDFGFLIPTPEQPELDESGNEAFSFLLKRTEPEQQYVSRPRSGGGAGCSCGSKVAPNVMATPDYVNVLEEKLVAGFNAVVLEASSATALVNWLKEHGYSYSPAIEAWAKPYVEEGWNITALKVAKEGSGASNNKVTASALRLSFKTDRPLFPYREPDPGDAAQSLNASQRLLRIYFIGDARYEGELTKEVPWTGRVAWSNKLNAEDRKQALELLNLPDTTGNTEWWLTEFEDEWPYRVAPADLYFAPSQNQDTVKRPPIIHYVSSPWPTNELAYIVIALTIALPFCRRRRSTAGH